jgi:endo-1,4-beta-mannosidase
MREAIREVDPTRPIGLGADAETLFRSNGVDARNALESCEFAVSHVTAAYRAYAAEGPLTSGPSTYLDSFLLRHAHRGRPVLLDDVGTLALDMSAGEEASYLRSVLWGGFINRAGGALVRRLRDMDTERREPYFIDPFETLVGLMDAEGVAKPAYTELNKFVRTVARIDLKAHTLLAERTAVLVPSERYEPLPNLAGLYDPRSCLHAFIATKNAHVPVAVIGEDDGFEEFQVLVVPSVFALADKTWERLGTFVQSGGTLLLSYGGGDAHPASRDLFGVEFLGDGGPREELSCRVAQPDVLGALESFDARFEVPNFALLSGGTATIVATDAQGSPLLTVNQVGQGRAVYIAVPLERAIAQGDPWATPAPIRHLIREVYGAVARAAGCGAPVECSAAEVEVALFQGEADDVVVLLNHSDAKEEAVLTLERRVASISDVRGGTPVAVGSNTFTVGLEPNGASALRLTYA